jgi:hypothetical protein
MVVACDGGGLGLAEYNTQGMVLATAMEERIFSLDADWDSQTATVEDARIYWEQRIEAYMVALEGFQALDPVGRAAELHQIGMELFSKLVAAEEALAARVAAFQVVTGPEQWWNSPEGAAVGAVEEEIYSLCLVFQQMYDATVDRVVGPDTPWLPSGMKEVVRADIGCETVRSDH